MEDFIQEIRFKVSNIELFFQLKNLLKFQVRSCSENPKDAIFESLMTNHTMSEPLKKRFGSVDELFTYFEFDAKQSQCKFIQNQKEAKLIFNDDENATYEISFLSLEKDQNQPQNPEISELKEILKQENELKESIARLQEVHKIVNQNLAQKINQLSSLRFRKFQIEKIVHKAQGRKKTQGKQTQIDIKQLGKYGKYFKYEQDRIYFKISKQRVTDKIVQEILQCNLSEVDILDFGCNEITDHGFDLLFQNKEWPFLQEILLYENKIQNIHSLHKIPNLQKLSIYRNELSEASCNYLCEHQWPQLKHLNISFKKGLNKKCWEKLLKVMLEKFPKLQDIRYGQKKDVNREIHQRIQKYCKIHSIKLHWY